MGLTLALPKVGSSNFFFKGGVTGGIGDVKKEGRK